MKKLKRILYVLSPILLISVLNKIIFTLSKLKNVLFSSNGYYYHWKFGKTFYSVKGKGQPILLVHSLNIGSSSYEFYKLKKVLSKKYKVYTIDLIGFGRSDKPRITYTSYLYVQLITDFIKEVIKEPTHIIASSRSTSFSIIACYQNPELFEKLLLVDPISIASLTRNPSSLDQIVRYILELPILGTLVYNIVSSKNSIRTMFNKKLLSKNIKSKTIQAFHQAAHLSGSSSKYIYASIYCHYLSVNIKQALENINNSIMMVIGNDIADKETIIHDYKQLNASIETINIFNCKHMPHLEKSDAIMKICDIYF